MQETLVQELKKLNLSEKEARVYIALLELGPATPYKIAKRAHLKRPTAYVITEELVEKGLIIQMTGERKRMYIARSPETYIADIESRVREAKKILPELNALQRKKSDKPNILYFEGIDGVKQAYDYKLKDFHGEEIVGFFARGTNLDERLEKEVFFPWNEYKEKHNIRVRGFTPDDPGLAPYGKYFNSKTNPLIVKFLPESLYNSACSLEMFTWGVRIVLMDSKQALVIESSEFALAMRQVFDLLWDKSKGEYDQPKKLSFPRIA